VSSPSLKKKSSSTRQPETLDALLKRLQIEQWDLLLIGDGSGSNWNFECGWGCISIEQDTMKRRCWHGAMNLGTVNLAEMLAYLQPLSWYLQQERRRQEKGAPIQPRHIHILTDSQYVQLRGKDRTFRPQKSNPLWQVFRQFGAFGMVLHWHWIPRETVDLNTFADKLSKAARLNLKGKDLQTQVEEKGYRPARSVYDINPYE